MEIDGVFRRAGAIVFAIPRQFQQVVNAGSIQNARQEVSRADRRRRIESTLELAALDERGGSDRAQLNGK